MMSLPFSACCNAVWWHMAMRLKFLIVIKISLKQSRLISLLEGDGYRQPSIQEADIVFAPIPKSRISFWHKFQVWDLQKGLNKAGRKWLRTSEKIFLLPHDEMPADLVEMATLFTEF